MICSNSWDVLLSSRNPWRQVVSSFQASNTLQLLNRILFFRKLWSVLYNFLLLQTFHCFKQLVLWLTVSFWRSPSLFFLGVHSTRERPPLLQAACCICKALTKYSNQGGILYLCEEHSADCSPSIPLTSILFSLTWGTFCSLVTVHSKTYFKNK